MHVCMYNASACMALKHIHTAIRITHMEARTCVLSRDMKRILLVWNADYTEPCMRSKARNFSHLCAICGKPCMCYNDRTRMHDGFRLWSVFFEQKKTLLRPSFLFVNLYQLYRDDSTLCTCTNRLTVLANMKCSSLLNFVHETEWAYRLCKLCIGLQATPR
jgi:hypothetical protein